MLIKHGAGTNDNLAFRLACENEHTEVVRLLLDLPRKFGIYPGACDNVAFVTAVRHKRIGIIRLLMDLPLKRGVDIHDAINSACGLGFTEIIQMLLTKNIELNLNPAIRIANSLGHTDIIRLLLKRQFNVDMSIAPMDVLLQLITRLPPDI
jgi:ankyrin repeat protein